MDKKIQELLSQKNERWQFPGTVYDTFIALTAIAKYDKRIIDGAAFGEIANMLISIESKPGGPYYSTFSKQKTHPLVFDHKTNAAIADFLSLYDIELEALSEFGMKKAQKNHDRVHTGQAYTPGEEAFMRKVRAGLAKRFASLDPEFKDRALTAIDKTIRRNPDKQMSLMPYYMQCALGKKSAHIPESLIVDMSIANIFFWTAFIIYDDFWDADEAADPRLLPVANLFARTYTDFFAQIEAQKPGFRKFFHTLMDDLDGANGWETAHCRGKRIGEKLLLPNKLPEYENYEKKYRPASGHIAGPVALLTLCGYSLKSSEVKNLILFFKHYLIAMQLNDDMHDWEEDLNRGHISTVVDILCRDIGVDRKEIDLNTDMPELRTTFWFSTLPKAAQKALHHTKLSRKALLSLKSLCDLKPLLPFVDLPERIAMEALQEQKQSADFVSSFEVQN